VDPVLNLRLAGAPISWGVCEVTGWGYQLSPIRVLLEAASLGLSRIEAGPEGFLPSDPGKVRELLAEYGLRLVGGFVAAILHRRELRDRELNTIERRAREIAAAGGEVLVLAAAAGAEGYDQRVEVPQANWTQLFETVKAADEISAHHGLAAALHPHHGTLIDRHERVLRFLDGCETALCLDTGHLLIGGSVPADIVRVAATRIRHVHLKDVDGELARQLGESGLGYVQAVRQGLYRPLGEGDAQIRLVVDGLRQAGYTGWSVLEQDTVLESEPPEGEGPVNDIRRSLEFLNA